MPISDKLTALEILEREIDCMQDELNTLRICKLASQTINPRFIGEREEAFKRICAANKLDQDERMALWVKSQYRTFRLFGFTIKFKRGTN